MTSGYPASVEPQDWRGADGRFLAKPYKAEALARIIGEALTRK